MKKTFELNLYHTSDTHGHLTSDPYNGQKDRECCMLLHKYYVKVM